MKQEVVKFPFYLQNNAKNKAKKAGGNITTRKCKDPSTNGPSVCKAITFSCDHLLLCDVVSLLYDVVSPLRGVVLSLCDVVSPLCDVVSSLCDVVSPLRNVVLSLCGFVIIWCGFTIMWCGFIVIEWDCPESPLQMYESRIAAVRCHC